MNEGQRKKTTEAAFRGGSQAVIAVREVFSALAAAEQRAEELEQDLRLNASMLARQCDMAREAETRAAEAERLRLEHAENIERATESLSDLWKVAEQRAEEAEQERDRERRLREHAECESQMFHDKWKAAEQEVERWKRLAGIWRGVSDDTEVLVETLRWLLLDIRAHNLARISDLTMDCEPLGCFERLYLCGFERDDNAGEAHTQWVKHKTSPFSSLSTPR